MVTNTTFRYSQCLNSHTLASYPINIIFPLSIPLTLPPTHPPSSSPSIPLFPLPLTPRFSHPFFLPGVKDPEEIRLMIKAVKSVRNMPIEKSSPSHSGAASPNQSRSNPSGLNPIQELSAKGSLSSIQAFVAPLEDDETPREGKGEGKGEGNSVVSKKPTPTDINNNPYMSKVNSSADINGVAGGGGGGGGHRGVALDITWPWYAMLRSTASFQYTHYPHTLPTHPLNPPYQPTLSTTLSTPL